MMLGAVLVMAGTSCSDNDEYDNPSRPVEPGDSYFSSEPVEEGPSLFDAATINTSKIPRVTSNKNTGLDEYYPLDPGDTWASVIRPERVKFFEKFLKEDMIFVNGGTFLMGATAEQGEGVHIDELPVHKVTVSDFYICRFEVTQEMYSYVMGKWENFSWKDLATTRLPMDNRLFSEMQTFCNKLNEITGLHFTLPTEAQWEYAAAGGESYPYAGSDNIRDVAYYASNANERLHPVGEKRENGFDLYDMSGNAAEWCTDWMSRYENTRGTDPQGPAENPGHHKKIVRGGSYLANERDMDIRHRSVQTYDTSEPHIGFRVVLNPIQ